MKLQNDIIIAVGGAYAYFWAIHMQRPEKINLVQNNKKSHLFKLHFRKK